MDTNTAKFNKMHNTFSETQTFRNLYRETQVYNTGTYVQEYDPAEPWTEKCPPSNLCVLLAQRSQSLSWSESDVSALYFVLFKTLSISG